MESIRDLMTDAHRQCDESFLAAERAVANGEWGAARAAFESFRDATLGHFEAEERVLFPAFEERTGMRMGPTQVMRGEHAHLRELMAAAQAALAAGDADDYSGTAETMLIMLQQHNMKEENVLYPMCDQHLTEHLETVLSQLRGGPSPAGFRK